MEYPSQSSVIHDDLIIFRGLCRQPWVNFKSDEPNKILSYMNKYILFIIYYDMNYEFFLKKKNENLVNSSELQGLSKTSKTGAPSLQGAK